ncbi:Guanine Nucleotide-Binding Protein G(S) Subunit Alpha Isoforms Xlas [Manis pentadactyla]|nr:Guanine Nucleotide-Binding Protein G(S) Subunit Alpha Isoforms Xlas [Manis pentadactyla]
MFCSKASRGHGEEARAAVQKEMSLHGLGISPQNHRRTVCAKYMHAYIKCMPLAERETERRKRKRRRRKRREEKKKRISAG